jgi:hypothetical protein
MSHQKTETKGFLLVLRDEQLAIRKTRKAFLLRMKQKMTLLFQIFQDIDDHPWGKESLGLSQMDSTTGLKQWRFCFA